uniref:DUF4220 domain-containing protein n=1 Tax=Oryza punctata TaxID=4537 RepID=A0A0E0MHA1_ORYPU
MAFLIFLYSMMILFSGILLFPMKRSMLSFLDAVSDAILVYVMGVMQAAPFKNQLFPVWALMLVSFRSSINALSSYGTYFELRNALKLLAVAYLNITHGSKLWHVPFWLFWSLLALKCCYRILARHVASQSLWSGRSSELLQEYMGANGKESNFNPERCNPETMEGYKYFVYGESQKSRKKGHSLSVKDLRPLVTLDKIWQCDDGMLVSSIRRQGKDLSLSFALSRLLRCRLEGAKLHADTVSMTRKLISKRILAEDPEDEQFGIRILELDVEFLRDSLHTSYPMVFCSGFLSLSFTILVCLVKLLVAHWLYKDISKVYSLDLLLSYKDLNKQGLGLYIDETRITTASLTSVITLEIWEILTYFISNWTKLLAMCKFVNCRNRCLKFVLNMLFRFHYILNLPKGFLILSMEWHTTNLMRLFRLFSTMFKWEMTLFIEARHLNARAADYAKARVIQALRTMDLEGHPLSKDLPSPRISVKAERYWLASVADIPRCSRVILVWHIATCLCEIKFANDSGTGLTWMSGAPFLVDQKGPTGELHKAHTVANYLSQYCLHLLVSKPKLLPEAILVSKKTLQDTIQCAHEMLKGCGSFQIMYDKLMEEPQKAPDTHDINLSGNILQQGAIMANALIKKDETCRWVILAEVWAHLIVHIAPSSKIEAHAEDLKSGSEFITVIWALFSHCGIEKSELWQQKKGAESGNSTSGLANQSSNVADTHVQEASPDSGMS